MLVLVQLTVVIDGFFSTYYTYKMENIPFILILRNKDGKFYLDFSMYVSYI